jgi:hypothetical protein
MHPSPFRGASFDFCRRPHRIPEGDHDHRDQPAGGGSTPFLDHPIVVRRNAARTQVMVDNGAEDLSRELGEGGKRDRGEYPATVHVLDPRLRVVAPGPHLLPRDRFWGVVPRDPGSEWPSRRRASTPACHHEQIAALGPETWPGDGPSTPGVAPPRDHRRKRSSQGLSRATSSPSFAWERNLEPRSSPIQIAHLEEPASVATSGAHRDAGRRRHQ